MLFRKKYLFLIVCFGILQVGFWIFIGYFIYTVFFIPEFVYVHIVYDGTIKITTEPNNLLQKGRIRRGTAIYLTLDNDSNEICKVKIKAKNILDSINDFELGPEGSSTSGNGGLFRTEDEKVEIEICGKSEILDFRKY